AWAARDFNGPATALRRRRPLPVRAAAPACARPRTTCPAPGPRAGNRAERRAPTNRNVRARRHRRRRRFRSPIGAPVPAYGRRPAPARASVRRAARAWRASALLRRTGGGVGLVALRDRRDQAFDALAAGDLGELAAVGF